MASLFQALSLSGPQGLKKHDQENKTGGNQGKEGAAEPVIISLNSLSRCTSSWYTLCLVKFDRLY